MLRTGFQFFFYQKLVNHHLQEPGESQHQSEGPSRGQGGKAILKDKFSGFYEKTQDF